MKYCQCSNSSSYLCVFSMSVYLVDSFRNTNQSPAGLGPLAAKSDTATGHQSLKYPQATPHPSKRASDVWARRLLNEQPISSCQRGLVGSSPWSRGLSSLYTTVGENQSRMTDSFKQWLCCHLAVVSKRRFFWRKFTTKLGNITRVVTKWNSEHVWLLQIKTESLI